MKKADLEKAIYDEINKQKLSPAEAKGVLRNFKQINPLKFKPVEIDFSEPHVKFLAFSDAHMGHKDYRPDVFRHMLKHARKEKAEFIVNAGDTIEGMSGRDGHIYELTHIGATAQMDYFAKEFRHVRGIEILSIEADSSHGGWFKSKGDTGLDIGVELDARVKNYKFIGYDEQDIKLDNGIKIRLRHPGGGTAYALSYKGQKYIESLAGGQKPNIIIQGHFHKSLQMFYRNCHFFDAGCLQDQSPFMKKKGTPAMVGYWIIDAYASKNKAGVSRVKSEWVPFYD